MNITPLQANFSAGELSPLMVNRTDLVGHSQAVEIMENMVSLSQGPAKNRDAMRFFDEFGVVSNGRVETFQVSKNRFFILVFLDFEVHFFLSDGTQAVAGLGTNSRFTDFGAGWTVVTAGPASLVVFEKHACNLLPQADGANRFAGIKQAVTLISPTEPHFVAVISNVEDNGDELRLMVGTTDGGTELIDQLITVDSAFIDITPAGATPIFIEVHNENNPLNPGNPIALSAFGVVDDSFAPSVGVTPYPSNELGFIQFIEAPEGDAIYVTHPRFPQQRVIYDNVLSTITFEPVVFIAPPVEWITGNYPATGVVHRGRIYYAGSPNEPEQIWASVVGDLVDMTPGVNADNGFSVVNAHFGAIQWMLSTKDLIFGTTVGEYVITSDGPVIFIGDIQIDRQSVYGSELIRADQIGDKVLYITGDSKRLHAMQFDRDSQTWLSDELSWASEHITQGGANGMSYAQYPHNLIWLNLIDGNWACCTYNRPVDVYGWHQHNTQGFVVDSDAGDENGISKLVSLVIRPNGILTLEISDPDGAPMDSRLSIQNIPASDVVSGLEHLEGLEVQVVADSAVHPNRTVVGGQITLQVEAEFIQVGLGFRKRMKTLPLDKGSNKGSARAYTKRYKDIYLGLLNSAIPLINGQQAPIRVPQDLMNQAPPLTTGLVKVSNLGFDKEATVDIIQDGPLPLQITGIYGEVVQDKT